MTENPDGTTEATVSATAPLASDPEPSEDPTAALAPEGESAEATVEALDTAELKTDSRAVYEQPVGLTNPPIDELLDRVSSKYALVIYAAKRARQINEYYNQLADTGIFEYAGPLLDPKEHEKPLSIALREIHEELLEHSEGADS